MIKSKDDLKKRLLEKSLLQKKQISNNKKNTYLFFFARCFQGVKPKFLKYDKHQRAFLILKGKKVYFYKPKIKFYFKNFRVIFFIFRNPERIKFQIYLEL